MESVRLKEKKLYHRQIGIEVDNILNLILISKYYSHINLVPAFNSPWLKQRWCKDRICCRCFT